MRRCFLQAAALALALACVAFSADISGSWEFAVETAMGNGSPAFEFKQDGEKLTGTYSGRLGKAQLSGAVRGDEVDFTFEVSSVNGKVHYIGKLDGATRMKGEIEFGDMGKGTFTAKKK